MEEYARLLPSPRRRSRHFRRKGRPEHPEGSFKRLLPLAYAALPQDHGREVDPRRCITFPSRPTTFGCCSESFTEGGGTFDRPFGGAPRRSQRRVGRGRSLGLEIARIRDSFVLVPPSYLNCSERGIFLIPGVTVVGAMSP